MMTNIEISKNNSGKFSFVKIEHNRSITTMEFNEYLELVKCMINPEFIDHHGCKYDNDIKYTNLIKSLI